MEFSEIVRNTRTNAPLVHCITNYVTVNDCANIILASGASPIMADDALEVEDITSMCHALVINIGTLNVGTIESMLRAGRRANHLGHPVILDPVGVGASALRLQTIMQLLKEVKFSVIRGNISEIKTIYEGSGVTQGVDAVAEDKITEENLPQVIMLAKALSMRTGAVIAITGAIDVVAHGDIAYVIYNGHGMMSRITGTGCMLTGVIGSFCGANQDDLLMATAAAVSAMGLCGELAYNKMQVNAEGTGSFKVYLMDYMSLMDGEFLVRGAKVKIK
ncbi:hydroxyethylthiazole kinase [Cellulosilyticum ruminicola]|uniref:hydroxyethylthiazole kinase n=1 Tax=Cellulosilyticum ruminicola TaxID=425254 RepID=UPI0006CF4B01|nr:hydroxyethylthiazole kinase [Cellulosilyticum ruminicola]